jgi:hypothetical protein
VGDGRRGLEADIGSHPRGLKRLRRIARHTGAVLLRTRPRLDHAAHRPGREVRARTRRRAGDRRLDRLVAADSRQRSGARLRSTRGRDPDTTAPADATRIPGRSAGQLENHGHRSGALCGGIGSGGADRAPGNKGDGKWIHAFTSRC